MVDLTFVAVCCGKHWYSEREYIAHAREVHNKPIRSSPIVYSCHCGTCYFCKREEARDMADYD